MKTDNNEAARVLTTDSDLDISYWSCDNSTYVTECCAVIGLHCTVWCSKCFREVTGSHPSLAEYGVATQDKSKGPFNHYQTFYLDHQSLVKPKWEGLPCCNCFLQFVGRAKGNIRKCSCSNSCILFPRWATFHPFVNQWKNVSGHSPSLWMNSKDT